MASIYKYHEKRVLVIHDKIKLLADRNLPLNELLQLL